VDWVLGKLRQGMSVILGDEMGLGKTIQAAVFLQVGVWPFNESVCESG
jgi:SNF2 family DNA or RNA helicase